MILSSNAAEYVQTGPEAPKHWSKHLSMRTWIIIGAVVAIVAGLGLLLLFDPTLFFPNSIK